MRSATGVWTPRPMTSRAIFEPGLDLIQPERVGVPEINPQPRIPQQERGDKFRLVSTEVNVELASAFLRRGHIFEKAHEVGGCVPLCGLSDDFARAHAKGCAERQGAVSEALDPRRTWDEGQ